MPALLVLGRASERAVRPLVWNQNTSDREKWTQSVGQSLVVHPGVCFRLLVPSYHLGRSQGPRNPEGENNVSGYGGGHL